MAEPENLISRIESYLQCSHDNASNELLQELQQTIQRTPDLSKNLGPFIGKIKSHQKMLANMEFVDWIQIGGG